MSLFLVAIYGLLSRGPLDLEAPTGGVVGAYEVGATCRMQCGM